MEWVALASIGSNIDYGITESAVNRNTGHKFLRITDIRDGKINWENVPFCEASEKDAEKYELQTGDIVFARTGSVGNTGLITNSPAGAVFASYLIRIRPNKKFIDPHYLSYFFQTHNYWQQIKAGATGAIQGGLNATKLKELSIPLPPLAEQKRIVERLAKADRLRQLRRYASQLGESYLQSVFLEMFGENSGKLKVEKLEGLTSLVSSGSTPLGGSKIYKEHGKRFIRSQNVLMNKFDFSDVVFIDDEIYNSMKRTFVKRKDVLLNITGASIGRVACYQDDTPANVNQHVCIIRCKPEKLNPVYLSYVISAPIFQEKNIVNQSGATRQALNFSQIKDFDIPLPPLAEQERFAEIVARYEGLRSQAREAARQGEGLFQSLLNESFGGDGNV